VSRLNHYYGLNHPHYLTTSIPRGGMARPSIDGFDSERLREQWVATFAELRQELGFRIVGYAPMPEHFHALIGPTQEARRTWYWVEANPSQIVQKLEDRTALFMLLWNDAWVLAIYKVPRTYHSGAHTPRQKPWGRMRHPRFKPSAHSLRYVPVPESGTAWGLPPPSSLNRTVAVRRPMAEGVTVTLTVRVAVAAGVLPHVFGSRKSPAVVPSTTICQVLTALALLFVSAITCGALLVFTGCGAKGGRRNASSGPSTCQIHGLWTVGSATASRQRSRSRSRFDRADGSPPAFPLRLTDCGLPPPSSLISNEALRVPAAEGVNVTAIVQLLPAASVAPQVLLCEKSAELGP
jgi:hypothetical protein